MVLRKSRTRFSPYSLAMKRFSFWNAQLFNNLWLRVGVGVAILRKSQGSAALAERLGAGAEFERFAALFIG
jgi:hypothetical protein